jgi:hypothetical protein
VTSSKRRARSAPKDRSSVYDLMGPLAKAEPRKKPYL